MDQAPFSIAAIVPLYNGRKYIERAVRSILGQTITVDEIVIVDDGSSDDGGELVQELAGCHQQIKLISVTNGGQSLARNIGAANCSANLLAFLDQDDWWYPRHLEVLLRPFTKKDRTVPLGWTYSDLDEMDGEGLLVTRNFIASMGGEHPKRSLISCLAADMYVLPSAALISREAFDSVGGFDPRLQGYEDDDLFLRMFRAGFDNEFIPRPLSAWRIYAGSTSYSPRMARSRMVFADKLIKAFPNNIARNIHYGRDLIVPRFMRHVMDDYFAGLAERDVGRVETAISDLKRLLPYASRRRRVIYGSVLPLLSHLWLARTAVRLGFHQAFRGMP